LQDAVVNDRKAQISKLDGAKVQIRSDATVPAT
jgi:hypothetical protein